MDLSAISNNIIKFRSKQLVQNATSSTLNQSFASSKLAGLHSDTISFGNIDLVATAETKMVNYIKALLEEKQVQPDQPIQITTDKQYLPFVKLMVREAYKMGAEVLINTKEPELEKLRDEAKAKARAKGEDLVDFEWKKLKTKYLEENNALFITFNEDNSPYKKAKLTQTELNAVIKKNNIQIPRDIQKKLEIIPSEIIDGKLNLRKGQPLRISADREHEPNVLKLVEYAYNNGSGPIEVVYSESSYNNLGRSFYEFASDKVLTEVPDWLIAKHHEYIDKNVASIDLEGDDPKALDGISPERITANSAATGKALKFSFDDQSRPWTIYYAPTTKSAIYAYPENKKGAIATPEEKLAALEQAAEHVAKINRVGQGTTHINKLKRIAETINNNKFKEIHFISKDIDPETQKPKTNLYIGLSPKSRFATAAEKTIPGKQEFVANCPTEEVFTSPDKRKTHGYVSATMPLSINGYIVDGIYMEFGEDGKITKFKATENEEIFKQHIEKHENANMLGEIALVADSPIYEQKRIFNSTLLDENATCHIAVGRGFPTCIEGYENTTNAAEIAKLVADNNVNDSTTHDDFMIGGPDIIVTGIKEDGTEITLIENNQFQI